MLNDIKSDNFGVLSKTDFIYAPLPDLATMFWVVDGHIIIRLTHFWAVH
ncbi:hypothetical protein CRENPOLYSF2_950002 [Crenothrix polyspora]|uniref:Uncharacterized protein n=1 Tax=Crenothrix polyspora TaxID=360316 RepID=A0A1R4HJ66_9GAMM|nr:hypothetical protein CRENPOLYSF2_950002 [Crenothrix polyspora]